LQRRIGKYERLAYERQARDIALASRPAGHPRGIYWDPAAADRPVQFIEGFCRHHKAEWAGQLLRLEEWQKAGVLRPVFGWKKADGTRRFRTAWIEIARKNGKTTKAGGVGLYLTVADGEEGAEVYCTATKEDQAGILWRDAAAMVKRSPDLQRFVKEVRSKGGRLYCERTSSFFRPLGADSTTLDGLNPHGHLPDEVHAHKDRGVWNILDTGMGARRQPLTFAITTAGTYAPDSVGWEQHDYAVKVLEGIYEDDSFFAFICAIDEGDDPFDPENWGKANPNLGISIKPSYLAIQAEKAKRQPSFYNEFLRLHLNVWTQQVTRWLSIEKWNESDPISADAALEQRAEKEKALIGKDCFAGLDLSSKLDLTALVLVFPAEDGFYDLICRFWLPEAKVEEEEKHGRPQYAQWAREGWLKTTPGAVIDYEFIRAEIRELGKLYKIVEIDYDPHNATHISTELGEQDGFTMVEHQQGFISMSEPSKTFEAEIVNKKIRHGGNPILRSHVANAVKKTDSAGNIKPDKAKTKGHIDGVVATIMPLGRAKIVGTGPTSYLETGPLLSI
jgi:phage terminase large subunit-like protein